MRFVHFISFALIIFTVSACGKLDVTQDVLGDQDDLSSREDLLKTAEFDFVFGKWQIANAPTETLEIKRSRKIVWTYEIDGCEFIETGYDVTLLEMSKKQIRLAGGGVTHQISFMSDSTVVAPGELDQERCQKKIKANPNWVEGEGTRIAVKPANGKISISTGESYEKQS